MILRSAPGGRCPWGSLGALASSRQGDAGAEATPAATPGGWASTFWYRRKRLARAGERAPSWSTPCARRTVASASAGYSWLVGGLRQGLLEHILGGGGLLPTRQPAGAHQHSLDARLLVRR